MRIIALADWFQGGTLVEGLQQHVTADFIDIIFHLSRTVGYELLW